MCEGMRQKETRMRKIVVTINSHLLESLAMSQNRTEMQTHTPVLRLFKIALIRNPFISKLENE